MFKNKNNINKIMFLLEKIDIKTKNLLTKPNKGGTPAKESKNNAIHIDILNMLLLYFRSFKVFNFVKSNKKNIKNKFKRR